MSLEILVATLAAGETKTFHMNGEYLEIIESQYPCDVLMQDRQGGGVGFLKNAEVSFYSRPKSPFGTLQITSPQAQTIRFFVGDGDAGTRRISSTVQVVDGEKARTLAGGLFAAAPGCSASPTLYPVVQLWNPVTSLFRVIVNSLSITNSAAGTVNVYFENAAHPNDVSATRAANKLGKASLGSARALASVAGVEAVTPYSIWGVFVPANGYVNWAMKGGIVLPPGSGLSVVSSVAGSAVAANYEWFEERI